MVKKILLITAMDKEGIAFTHKYGFEPSNEKLLIPEVPAQIFKKQYTEDSSVIFIISGKCPLHNVNRIGPHIHSLALIALASFRPDLVINTGFAGGFSNKGANIGDIYFAEDTVFNHDRHFTENDPYKKYCEGGFPVHKPDETFLKKLNAKLGQVTSSGSMLASKEEIANMQRFGTIVKDMETSAIAEAAFLMGTPFIAAKIITDLVDSKYCSQEQFNENYPVLVSKLETLNHELISLKKIKENK